ncbi:HEAT repeat domain-containing protein [Solibacillus sp. FSL W8-0474]|uniref:HEAT repeat domain-containing protein n=1 Tax=Solibacillus sp. FSL W8-0474 TaxID=2975336 RepID=UPI0030F6C4F4
MNHFIERVKENILKEDEVLQDVWLSQLMEYPLVPAEFTNELVAFAKEHERFQKKLLLNGDGFEKNKETITLLQSWITGVPADKKHLITRFLIKTPTKTLLEFEKSLTPYMPKGYFDVLKRYSIFETNVVHDFEPLWEHFGELLSEMDIKFDSDIYFTAKKVQDLLIRSGEYDPTEVEYILRDEVEEKYISVNGILAVRAVGCMGLSQHIPKLVSLLNRIEEDILQEEVCEALIRFQSDEVVKLLAPHVVDESLFISVISVLKHTKTKLAEQVLAEAYGKAEDVDMQELILEGLAAHFSEAAFECIEEYIERGETGYMVDMDELFYAYFKAMNQDHPLLETWRADAIERNEFFEEEMQSMKLPSFTDEQTTKVGRNDPCPCGSKKKYKKCCGK